MTATTQSASTTAAAGSGVRARLSGFFNQDVVLALLVVTLTIFVWLVNPRFLAQRNVLDMLNNSSYIAVAAIGMTMVIISGNIDISVGSLIGLLATISGQIAIGAQDGGYPLWIAFIVPLFVGALIEAFIGFLVAYLRIPSIVVSLGMFSILKGALILWTNGVWIYNLPDDFMLAQQAPLGVPVPIYFMVILTILAALWMKYSATGRAIYAVGGNREAARLSGISEKATIMKVFIINGVMVGIASILFATQFNAIQSTVPPGLELFIITASVVGGVSILGGTGTVIGSTLGSILLHVIRFGMQFVDVSQYWLQAVQGILILVTVMVDLLRRRRQSYSGRG